MEERSREMRQLIIFFVDISQISDHRNVICLWKEKRPRLLFVRASFPRTLLGRTAVVLVWAWLTVQSANYAPNKDQVSKDLQDKRPNSLLMETLSLLEEYKINRFWVKNMVGCFCRS